MIKAKLLKPLDGQPEGSEAEFTNTDFETLERMGAVARAATEEALPSTEVVAEPAPVEVPTASEPEIKEVVAPENKMEPAPQNKATAKPATKRRG